MSQEEIYGILTAVIAFVVIITATSLYYKNKLKKIEGKNKELLMKSPDLSFLEAMEILDTIIADVISNANMVLTLHDVKYVKDIPVEVIDKTQEVVSLMSDSLAVQLECYVSKDYIVGYISRNIRGFYMDYSRKKIKE